MIENTFPLVSVITPFLNAENFLVETIESVIQQEYKNWELILVDDGSSDNSTGIAKEYAYKYPDKIIYLEHEGHANKAAAASRNLALTKAKGELAALLDADDFWLPQYLGGQVAIFKNNPQISMLCEASHYWYSWISAATKDIIITVGAPADRVYQPPELAIKLYPLGAGAAPCPCGIVVTMAVLKRINGFEESFIRDYQMYEDQAFLMKIYLHQAVYISSTCNNFYRQRAGSVMHVASTRGQYLKARFFFLQWLHNYLKENKINNREIFFLLKKSFLFHRCLLLFKVPDSLFLRLKKLIRNNGLLST